MGSKNGPTLKHALYETNRSPLDQRLHAVKTKRASTPKRTPILLKRQPAMARITPDQVTCIIPYAGAVKYVEEVVGSALMQQFGEVLLVNDGFPLSQLDVVAKLPGVRIITLENSGGCSNARNLGIRASKTPYIVLLDHDDVLCEGYFEAMSRWMEANQARCAAATLRYIGENSKNVGAVVSRKEDFCLPSGFLSEVRLIEEAGFFPNSYSDDVLFFRAMRQIAPVKTCPEAFALYRIHPQAESSKNAKAWWAFNQLLPLLYAGTLSLTKANTIAREFAHNGIVPPGMESRLAGDASATVRFLSRSAYASWLNRDLTQVGRYALRLVGHLPALGQLARKKWLMRAAGNS
jgi:glycosyltransferase involved in cell wall biosynthesis